MATEQTININELPLESPVKDDDNLLIEDSTTTKRVTAEGLADYINNKFFENDGILPISKGGTGNANGYIQTGHKADTNLLANSTYEGTNNIVLGNNSHAEGSGNESRGDNAHIEGRENHTTGDSAHAEGVGTQALGNVTHTEGYYTKAIGDTAYNASHAEGKYTRASAGAHSEGVASEVYPNNLFDYDTYEDEGKHIYAYGYGAHAEGYASTSGNTPGSIIAYGNGAHAEGQASKALSWGAHAEGGGTLARGANSHSEGWHTKALASATHAEGYGTKATEYYSHAEGEYTTACGNAAHAEGLATRSFDPETDSLENDEGFWVVASGQGAHAEGKNDYIAGTWCSLIASGEASHAEGCGCQATYEAAHAEGNGTKSSGMGSHSEGDRTNASGYASHAGGLWTEASGVESFAHGRSASAIGFNSTAFGNSTIADGNNSFAAGVDSRTEADTSAAFGDDTYAYGTNQFCIGMCNTKNGQGKGRIYISGYKLFQIGNGISAVYNGDELITPEARSNVFSVSDSAVYGTGTYNTSGADYAEMFEWEDGNPNNEDRAGKFVTLNGDKLILATSSDDYILGVVSGKPSVCGDVADDQWNKMYLTDVYGRPLYEDIDYPEEKNEEGNVIREAQTATRLKLNPDYDSTKEYIPRSSRPEWSPVGLLGKLVCIDDGTAEVNSYVKVNDDSIATASSERTKYRVMERLDENHIRIMIL